MRKIFKIVIFSTLLFYSIIPLPIIAQTGADDASQPTGAPTIDNPIGISDPRLLIGRIISAILGIVGSIALGVFVYGGFTWMLSGGRPEMVQRGKQAIIWSILGLAIIFLSYAVVTFVIQAFTGA